MSHAVFHVVSEDIEEEHITADMQPTSVHEHGSDEGEVDRVRRVKGEMRGHPREQCLGYAMYQRQWYDRIGKHEGWSVRAKRNLVEKDDDVGNNQSPCHPGKAPARPWIVLDRNHVFFPH